jgi:hypothetical protein
MRQQQLGIKARCRNTAFLEISFCFPEQVDDGPVS